MANGTGSSPPSTAAPTTPEEPPRGPVPPGPSDPEPPRHRPRVAPLDPPDLHLDAPPETSRRAAQTVLLALGTVVLAIAAVVFVGVLTELDPWGRLVILLVVAAIAMAVAVPVAARGLTATADAIAVIGLALVAVSGYALWTTGTVTGLPGASYAGLVAAATAGVGYGYHRLTGLVVPRFAGLILLQPSLPLVATAVVDRPSDWALVFTLVAAANAVIGYRDLKLTLPPSRRRLRHLAWVLHAVALLAAAGFAVTGLLLGQTVDAALRATGTLLLVTAVGLVGAMTARRRPMPEVAAGAMTLALIGGLSRVMVVALPGNALLPVTAVVAVVGVGLLLVPPRMRRGPAIGVAIGAGLLGVVVAVLAIRAGVAAVTAVLPAWSGDLSGHGAGIAAGVAGTGWQLPTAAALLTVAAVAVPWTMRREAVVIGIGLTALAVPAGYGLGPLWAPWILLLAAAALGVTALEAYTRRAATVHLVVAAVVGAAAAGASLATTMLTATVLTAISITATVVAWGRPRHEVARPVLEWAAGAGALALPGAAATGAWTVSQDVALVLAASYVAVCATLGYAALTQLDRGVAPAPVTIGAGLGAVIVTGVAFTAPTAGFTDRGIAALLGLSALLIVLAPRIDAVRPATARYSGSDLAAAAVTASVVATLARITAVLLPIDGRQAALAVGGSLVLVVALGIRTLPPAWRRGPVLGLTLFGAMIAGLAAVPAVLLGGRTLAVMWSGELSRWPGDPVAAGVSWAAPYALLLVAAAAALVLVRPVGANVAAVLLTLATVSAPIAFGLPWWAAAGLPLTVAAALALSTAVLRRPAGLDRLTGLPPPLPPTAAQDGPATDLPADLPTDPAAAQARARAAAALLIFAFAASLARPGATALVLALVVIVAGTVAGLIAAQPDADAARLKIGGLAVIAILLAGPGALAAYAGHLGHPWSISVLAALAASSLGVATLAVLRERIAFYLPYGSFGVAAGATVAALTALGSPHPVAVYAAAAALLAVLAELIRANTAAAPIPAGPYGAGNSYAPWSGWSLSPPAGAAAAAVLPAVIALAAVAPALAAVLLDPYQVIGAPWQGPPPELTDPAAGPAIGAASVLAVLLLTLAAAIAAVGFGGPVTRQAVPLVAPGLAVTILITPAAFGTPWPASTAAALVVFSLAVLGVALTPPPPRGYRARPLRVTRRIVILIGVAAGGAGLAGSLATLPLTWVAVAVVTAVATLVGLGGQTEPARLAGWFAGGLGMSAFAVLTGMMLGVGGPQLAYFLLVAAALALLGVARLYRLQTPAAARELAAVEWVGGYLPLLLALLATLGAPPQLAGVLGGAAAILGGAALRAGRSDQAQRFLLWAAAVSAVAACWVLLWWYQVPLLEAYTLPFAACALLVGLLESRRRPELGSWAMFGPALIVALGPSLLLLVVGPPAPLRQAYVLVGGLAALVLGSRLRQRAPLIIGTVATTGGALHLLSLAGPWLMLIPVGLLLLILGANDERRARDLARLRGAYSRMR